MTFRINSLTRTIRTFPGAATMAAVLIAPTLAHAAAGPTTGGQQHAAMESGSAQAANVAFLAAHGVLASFTHGHVRLVF